MRKKKSPKRVISSKIPVQKKIQENIYYPSFHETFPITLKYLKCDEKKVCYFQCEEHMKTYIERSKLKKNQYKLEKTLPKEFDEEN
jgi:hypothetical protein